MGSTLASASPAEIIFDIGSELRHGLTQWIQFYTQERGHASLDDRTPDEVYYDLPLPLSEAA